MACKPPKHWGYWEPTKLDAEIIRDALAFYEQFPDGQYDSSVVVPLLEAELERRDKAEK